MYVFICASLIIAVITSLKYEQTKCNIMTQSVHSKISQLYLLTEAEGGGRLGFVHLLFIMYFIMAYVPFVAV